MGRAEGTKDKTGDLSVVNSQGGKSGKHPKEKDWRLNSVAEVRQQKSSDVLGQDAPFAKFSLDAAHMPGMKQEDVARMTNMRVLECRALSIEQITDLGAEMLECGALNFTISMTKLREAERETEAEGGKLREAERETEAEGGKMREAGS